MNSLAALTPKAAATPTLEALDVLGAPMIVRSAGETVRIFLAEHDIPPGYGVPLHAHEADDELFYVLEGELTLVTEAGEARVGAGACVPLPHGQAHGYRNDTGTTVRTLVMSQPGLQAAELFRHLDRAGRAARDGLAPEEVAEIAGQYGVAFRPPPAR